MKHKPEHFRITKTARRYDKQTGTFTINIAYETAPPTPTQRVTAVAESFGLGLDQTRKFTLYDNIQLKIGKTDITYITGDSGSGKSALLKALENDIKNDMHTTTINITDIQPEPDKPIIETIGQTYQQALELLSKVGLNDAFLFLRSYQQLSDGQKYRYRTAKMIESKAQFWIMDEFAATLDRDTAKTVAYNLQKHARQQNKAVLAATTHTDLLRDLNPSIHIHKRYGKEITVRYHTNKPAPRCSLTRQMHITQGTTQDWQKLAEFHYRSHRTPAPRKIFTLKRTNETCGTIVYSYPAPTCFGRKNALPKMNMKQLNKHLSTITRIVIHPKYRSIGLGTQLIKDTLDKAGTEHVEMIAVMAKYNPFAEKAGMKRTAEQQPPKQAQNILHVLEKLGFNPQTLSSTSQVQQKLKTLNKNQTTEIRKAFTENKHTRFQREFAQKQPYCKPEKYTQQLQKAQPEKLAHLITVCAFLLQPKTYLIWHADTKT